jgi:hypothetical protein
MSRCAVHPVGGAYAHGVEHSSGFTAGKENRLDAASLESLQRSKLASGSQHTEMPSEVPSNRVVVWFQDHPFSTLLLVVAGMVVTFIALLA